MPSAMATATAKRSRRPMTGTARKLAPASRPVASLERERVPSACAYSSRRMVGDETNEMMSNGHR